MIILVEDLPLIPHFCDIDGRQKVGQFPIP